MLVLTVDEFPSQGGTVKLKLFPVYILNINEIMIVWIASNPELKLVLYDTK